MKRAVLLTAALTLSACRGQPSADAPIHPIPDMRVQPKVKPAAASAMPVNV